MSVQIRLPALAGSNPVIAQLQHAFRQLLHPGQSLFLAGSSGASQLVLDTLEGDPDLTCGVNMLTSLVPGINRLDRAKLHPSATVTGPFPIHNGTSFSAPELISSRATPLTYGGFLRYLREQTSIDLAVVQVTPPNEMGQCSLGPAAEFMPVVLGRARKLLGLVNPHMPWIKGAPTVDMLCFDTVVEAPCPLATYEPGHDSITTAVAQRIAPLITDGAVLQLGLGKVPDALAGLLTGHRNLRFHTGLLSDSFIRLWDAGAIQRDQPQTASVAVGSRDFYQRLPDITTLSIRGCEHTHNPTVLGNIPRFTAINSALEVDLFGQCNMEMANGRLVSAAGGAPDFAHGARLAPQGVSIIALPSTHAAGSRILPSLTSGKATSLHRLEADYIVTEHGVANIRGLGLHERAEALITIAAPEYRAGLTDQWRQLTGEM